MKLFRHSLRHRQRQLPAWAIETTAETATVHRDAEALVAESRSRAWVSASTGLLRVIRADLERLDDPHHPSAEPPSWVVVSGEQVAIGDMVIVDLGTITRGTIEGSDPEFRLPLVRFHTGRNNGQLVRLTPGQIMRRQ